MQPQCFEIANIDGDSIGVYTTIGAGVVNGLGTRCGASHAA